MTPFCWDDDFSIVFEDGFISGIKRLIGGSGRLMGYGYEDVCSIFTDAGIKAPLLLVGSEAAYEARGDVALERMKKIPNPFDEGFDKDEDLPKDTDDLPFS